MMKDQSQEPLKLDDDAHGQFGDTDLNVPNKTKQDIARFLGVTCRTIESYMAYQSLPHYKLGCRRVRFRLSDVNEWLEHRHKLVR